MEHPPKVHPGKEVERSTMTDELLDQQVTSGSPAPRLKETPSQPKEDNRLAESDPLNLSGLSNYETLPNSTPTSPFLSPMKTELNSPMKSSTPLSSAQHSVVSWKGSPDKSALHGDTSWKKSPIKSALHKDTSWKGSPDMSALHGDTSVHISDSDANSSHVSVPLLPKNMSSMYSYLTTDTSLGKSQSSQCLVYIVSRDEIVPSSSADELYCAWKLSLERQILGHSRKCLPTCTIHILQLLMIAVTIATLTSCLLFGIRLPNNNALQWLVLTLVALLEYFFVMETVKVFMHALYSALSGR